MARVVTVIDRQIPLLTAREQHADSTPTFIRALCTGRPSMASRQAAESFRARLVSRLHAHGLDHGSLLEQIPDVLAWTTWTEMSTVVAKRAREFTSTDTSVEASVRRLAESLTSSIHRHA